LVNPEAKPIAQSDDERQHQYNQRGDARSSYQVIDGQLYRKPSDPQEQPRYVVCEHEVFERIKTVHLQLGHAGKNKTFEILQKRYYGITRAETIWLLKHCRTCLLNRPSNTKGPLEPIVFWTESKST